MTGHEMKKEWPVGSGNVVFCASATAAAWISKKAKKISKFETIRELVSKILMRVWILM